MSATLAVLPATTRLTEDERSALAHCEQIIDRGIKIYYEVGEALAHISEHRLYRETHKSFEAYCRERWNMGRNRAYQYIDASEVYAQLSEMPTRVGTLPQYESHARPLTTLPDEAIALAWQVVVDTAPNGVVTTRHTQSVVSVLKEVLSTQAIDDGTGADIPVTAATLTHVKAAVIEETYERMQRQEAHIINKSRPRPALIFKGRVTLLSEGTGTAITFTIDAPLNAVKGASYAMTLYEIQEA